MAAVLGFGGGYYSQRVYLMEARRLGLSLNPPHINHSDVRFRVTYPNGDPQLYMGLDQVRDLTRRTIAAILRQRPFQSLEDFLIRVDPQRKETQHLAMVGALDGLTTIPQALARIEQKRPPGQLGLFGASDASQDWPLERQLDAQQQILGISLGASPLEQIADEIRQAGALTTLEAENHIGEKVVIAGMRQTWRRLRARTSNQMMCYLNLEDLEGSLQVLVPPRVYRTTYQQIREPGPFLIEGVIEKDTERQTVRMVAEKITLVR
jgi:DNA polymerase-3 subunit alpha